MNAAALFEVSGNTLTITLTNTGDTSGGTADKSANTLTGLFFDLPTGITLTPSTATVAAGDIIQADLCNPGPCDATTTNVGGEFAYATGTWTGHEGNVGISSSGYINGDSGSGNFIGPNLDDPSSPDGVNFGIVAPVTLSNPLVINGGNLANDPLIEGEVVFTMTISGGVLLESQISNVSFQYGTSISEPKFNSTNIVVVPDPSTIPEPAISLLLVPAAVWGLRRRRGAVTA